MEARTSKSKVSQITIEELNSCNIEEKKIKKCIPIKSVQAYTSSCGMGSSCPVTNNIKAK